KAHLGSIRLKILPGQNIKGPKCFKYEFGHVSAKCLKIASANKEKIGKTSLPIIMEVQKELLEKQMFQLTQELCNIFFKAVNKLNKKKLKGKSPLSE
ncbi:hypothetical protein V1477_003382, partial [Vespula maculifrons]